LVSVDDDDMFGTSTPKKIGESWPVGVDAMQKPLKEIGAHIIFWKIRAAGQLRRFEVGKLVSVVLCVTSVLLW